MPRKLPCLHPLRGKALKGIGHVRLSPLDDHIASFGSEARESLRLQWAKPNGLTWVCNQNLLKIPTLLVLLRPPRKLQCQHLFCSWRQNLEFGEQLNSAKNGLPGTV